MTTPQPQPPHVRVVIVDDDELFRGALSLLLDRQPPLHVVGTAASGPEGIDLAACEQADVVIMDVRMPGVDGIEATRRLLALRPTAKVLAVSAADDDHEEADALDAGAARFLRKDRLHETIVDAILATLGDDRLH